jgi:zinc protease
MPANYRLPALIEHRLDNGLQVIWLADHEQPLTMVEIQFCAGKFCNEPLFEGTAELTANLIQKGPASCSSETFSERIENSGASLFSDLGDEYLSFGIKMLSRASDDLLPLFWEMIINPAFDAKECSRIRKEMITGLQAEYAEPALLASKHFSAELFNGHPAGRCYSTRSVKAVSIDVIRGFHSRFIVPANATMVIAGDFDFEAMQAKYEPLFRTWRAVSITTPTHPQQVPPLSRTRIRCIDKPGISQTSIVMGHTTVGEVDEAKTALTLANYIIGGGNFSSRLMARIRSQTGNTYGISSHIHAATAFGAFMISTTTQNQQLEEVMNGITEEYRTLIAEGVTEDELQKAKQFALGHLAFDLEGVGNVVEKILWLRLYSRSNDYLEKYPAQIASVDVACVNTALREKLHSPYFVIGAVGTRREIQGVLERFGEVTVKDFRAEP